MSEHRTQRATLPLLARALDGHQVGDGLAQRRSVDDRVDQPPIAVSVECSDYYALLAADDRVRAADEPKGIIGVPSHSWYFGNSVFTRDIFDTMIGIKNGQRVTRAYESDGKLHRTRGAG